MTATTAHEYRGKSVSYTTDAGIVTVTVRDAAELHTQDVGALAYWFCYSQGTGPSIHQDGITRNEDGSADVRFRL